MQHKKKLISLKFFVEKEKRQSQKKTRWRDCKQKSFALGPNAKSRVPNPKKSWCKYIMTKYFSVFRF